MAKRPDHRWSIPCAGTAINGFANPSHTNTDKDTLLLTTWVLNRFPRTIALFDRLPLDALGQTPFVNSTELALILGEPHSTGRRVLADGFAGRVNHGTAHLPSSRRYDLTASGIRESARVFGFDTPLRATLTPCLVSS